MNELEKMKLYREAFAILERMGKLLDEMHDQNLADLEVEECLEAA